MEQKMEQKAFISFILASMLAATLHAEQSPTQDGTSAPSLESTSKDVPSTPTMLNPVSAFARENALPR